MAMVIMNNGAAMQALHENDKNSNKLSKDLKKVVNGMKINGAQDGASEYYIGKKMDVMIRSLGQDIENVKTGKNLIRVAEGGIQEVINNLREIKELAINSANDHNTDIDRETLQKDVEEKLKQITNIAATTNYNGRLLLNGDYSDYGLKVASGQPGTQPGTPIQPVNTTKISNLTGAATIIYPGNYTINTDGIYMLAPNYSGTITVNAQNVELRSATGSVNTSTYIDCPNANTNLWINELRIDNSSVCNTTDKSIIRFSGVGNSLNIIGDNCLSGQGKNTAVINIGDELTTYYGSNSQKGHLRVEPYYQLIENMPLPFNFDTYGAIIGSDGGEISNGSLIVNGGLITAHGRSNAKVDGNSYVGQWGACVGSGANGTFGSITVNGGQITGGSGGLKGAGIGTGFKGTITGDIIVNGGAMYASIPGNELNDAQANYRIPASAAALGCGIGGTIMGNISIYSLVRAESACCGAAIGTAGDDTSNSSVGDITISNTQLKAIGRVGEAVGRGASPSNPECNTSGYSFYKFTDVNVLTGLTGNISIDAKPTDFTEGWNINGEKKYHMLYIPPPTQTQDPPISDNEGNQSGYEYFEGHPLIIHTGTKANQHLRVYINSMHPIALGVNGLKINPRDNAVKSLDKIDSALEYALKENTKMGAYQSRLDKTDDTLNIANENTTNAMSNIVNTDMTKSMSAFVKDKVLLQSSQFILAQANQNIRSVLQLLQ